MKRLLPIISALLVGIVFCLVALLFGNITSPSAHLSFIWAIGGYTLGAVILFIFFPGGTSDQRNIVAYSLPISVFTYWLLETACALCFIFIPSASFELAVFFQTCLFIIAIAITFALILLASRANREDASISESSSFILASINSLNSLIDHISSQNDYVDTLPAIESIRDKLYFSDPISTAECAVYESELSNLINSLCSSIYSDTFSNKEIINQCNQIQVLLSDRNRACVSSK